MLDNQTTRKLIRSRRVREILGDISPMTLWRLEHDDRENFPQPRHVIRSVKYWDASEVETWFRARAVGKVKKVAGGKG